MATIGIIANPAAGKDVRRIVAHGFSVDNEAKVSMVRRVILGAVSLGCDRILLMPDSYHIGARALAGLGTVNAAEERCLLLDMLTSHTAVDTLAATRLMQAMDAGCIVTLGGDGTVRLAAKAAPTMPLLPISTGTNNVLPTFVEATVAGMAAALVATCPALHESVLIKRHGLVVRAPGLEPDLALVDVASLRGTTVGARAVWDWRPLNDVIAVSPRADAIGLSAIVGACFPESPLAAWVQVGSGESVLAAIAPGMVMAVPIAQARTLTAGESVSLDEGPCVIALDGEREMVAQHGPITVEVQSNCATIVDVHMTLTEAAKRGLMRSYSHLSQCTRVGSCLL
ncbi:MAG: NAD(+)/NADH kinase [Anaerolineae bacterium]